MIEFLRELIAIQSPSGEEAEVAARCAAEMRALGYDVEVDALGNVIGRLGDTGPLLLFDAHCDTVAAGEGWTRDPFDPALVDGRVYGRGATDMKGAIAALVHGLAAAPPRCRVAVTITTLEETAEGVALAPVCDTLAPDGVIIAEPSGCRLVHAQKGRAELFVTVRGRIAHAAFPDLGRNALNDAARLLVECERRVPADDPELGRALLVATEAVTSPRPGISVVPDRCDIRFDRRLLVDEQRAAIVGEMEQLCIGLDVQAEVVVTAEPVTTYTGVELAAERWLPAWRTAADDRLRLAAEAAVGPAGVPYLFCTNGSVTAGRGIPTLGYGPGDTSMAHQPDEWIAIDQVERAARGYAALAQMDDWRTNG